MAKKKDLPPKTGIATTVHQPSAFQIRKFSYELNDHMPPPGSDYEKTHPERYTVTTGLAAMVPGVPEKSQACGLVISFEIILQPNKAADESWQRFKHFDLDCEAFFLIKRDIPGSFINRAFLENCFALLYGTMRGYAASMTASVHGGPVVLPAIIMDPQLDRIEVEDIVSDLRGRLIPPAAEESVKAVKASKKKSKALPEG